MSDHMREQFEDMTSSSKPEVVAWGSFYKGVMQDFGYSQEATEAIAKQDYPGYTLSIEPLIRLSDYEALQAECEKLRKGAAAALSGLPDSFPMEPYQTVDRSSPHYKAGWNACRRAMLDALEKLMENPIHDQ